ncbi:endoplasmic reticulum junction formation protein lunapark-B-like [Anopheles stephensi]|uniref:endoplasmic reticulum junction formation protein lunapark-B-like n=1 Tax=Anopheles stephensi TaxID=30069 RepID=UPI001658AD8C|nr:endoplasmic reticulum junction formation protein lunapark-B-like [Anopheles stephensi]XP_035916072.1 endoplasmic reticulum junction formation protein lunapark-B-like [Anopheles stephensi]XP_035918837.1 endoplasmic reticulum junction formation protein lunapark-B-like [Anopheles stephensi]XP_035918838.1 endoplasmic reticulum junction formation protein lunapark-B-like [Anopheles stephensi]
MGVIISRFRKEKSTFQKLEELEEKIKSLEAYTISTQERRKRFVGRFLVTSIVLYIVGSLIFYFIFFPPTWNERIVYSVPLLICPILIFVLKRVLAWHYERKLRLNANKLKDLRTDKKKILENVMEKETYKVAVEILDKFGDKSHRIQTQAFSASLTPLRAPKPMPVGQPAPRMPTPNVPQRQQISPPSVAVRPATPMTPQMRPTGPMLTPHTAPGLMIRGPPPQYRQQSPMYGARVNNAVYRRTPFPIINQSEKGVLEKMVDYLVGDGPTNRFAMICAECCMHNGMVLKEEYEYTAFRCAFCNALNPAKKQRPVAPLLPYEQNQLDRLSQKPDTSSESEGDEDGEEVRSSAGSSQSGEPRSPGVGEEEPFEPEQEVKEGEMLRNIANSEAEKSPDVSDAAGGSEASTPNDDDDDDTTGTPATLSNPDSTEVPSRPETVGSKKVD